MTRTATSALTVLMKRARHAGALAGRGSPQGRPNGVKANNESTSAWRSNAHPEWGLRTGTEDGSLEGRLFHTHLIRPF